MGLHVACIGQEWAGWQERWITWLRCDCLQPVMVSGLGVVGRGAILIEFRGGGPVHVERWDFPLCWCHGRIASIIPTQREAAALVALACVNMLGIYKCVLLGNCYPACFVGPSHP